MFKSVEYVEFEGRDELRRTAEAAVPILRDEVTRLAEMVVVRWVNNGNPSTPVTLELTLTMPTGTATTSGVLAAEELTNPDRLRVRCRKLWLQVLGQFIDDQLDHIQESWKQPVGV